MPEITMKVKNNPSSFAKVSDFLKTLSAFYLGSKDITHVSEALSEYGLPPNGTGGVPLYYDINTKRIYADASDKHSMIIGATASKKSRLVAMPTVMLLGAAEESMIISDPKAEIYLQTATYLEKHGFHVQLLNLREPQNGSAWNPLYIPYLLYKNGEIDRAYEFANDIAINLTKIDKSEKEAFWDNSAGSFFFGLILLLFKYCDEYGEPIEAVNIGNILKLRSILCSGTTSEIRKNPLWLYAKQDPFISSVLIGTIETANDTRAGILSTFDQKMRAFSIQPSLLGMLSHNSIHYEELIQRPTAIFLILPDEKTGYHNLASLFIKQSYEYLIFEAQRNINSRKAFGNRINYILDEFSSLPTITDFPAMVTAARSRNIRFNLFLQSRHQLKLRYGEECETIMSNCENWIFLTSRELDLLKEISELCGTTGGGDKPLLSVTDLQRLDKNRGEVLILSGRNKPLISRLADISAYVPSMPPVISVESPQKYDQHDINFSEFMDSKREISVLQFGEPQRISQKINISSGIDFEKLVKELDEEFNKCYKELDKDGPSETASEKKDGVTS